MHITERFEHGSEGYSLGDAAEQAAPPPFGVLDPGTRIGRYVVEGVLASGGFGVVYRARTEHAGARDVAVKVLHADLTADPTSVRRFEREIDVIRRLRHPCVVRIFDVGTHTDGQPFYAMELIDGEDLDAMVQRCGPLSPAEAVRLLSGLCDALTQAHRNGIVHRDLKPSNVMVRADQNEMRPVLLDFGVAKLLDPVGPGLTNSRAVLGTPSCMAPEQIEGKETDARTDVYALGALLYFMLTGRPAFHDVSPVVTMHLHLRARPPLASRLVPACAPLDDVIVRALSKSPNDRFDGAEAFFSAASAALEGQPGAAVERRADAIWLAAEVDVEEGAEEDDALMAAIEDVLSELRASASALGLHAVLEAGNASVFAAALPADREGLAARKTRVFEAVKKLREELARKADDRLRIQVSVAEAEAVLHGDAVVDGAPLHHSLADAEWSARCSAGSG